MNNSFSFIALYGSYKSVELRLYCNGKHLDTLQEKEKRTSSILIPLIDNLLQKNNISLKSLDFIALDIGPGSFTSLRVIISTMNGVAHASKIPLVGIDGLKALAQTTMQKHSPFDGQLVCLLNAYNKEVYHTQYRVFESDYTSIASTSYTKAEAFLQRLSEENHDGQIIFTGNGSMLHQELIKELFAEQQYKIVDIPHASAESIATLGIKKFECHEILQEVQPLYLKKSTFVKRC